MTKILYIPTGEYLKYYDHTDDKHMTIQCKLEKVMNKEDIEIDIEEILHIEPNTYSFRNWVELNNLVLPVLRNELEIIEDD